MIFGSYSMGNFLRSILDLLFFRGTVCLHRLIVPPFMIRDLPFDAQHAGITSLKELWIFQNFAISYHHWSGVDRMFWLYHSKSIPDSNKDVATTGRTNVEQSSAFTAVPLFGVLRLDVLFIGGAACRICGPGPSNEVVTMKLGITEAIMEGCVALSSLTLLRVRQPRLEKMHHLFPKVDLWNQLTNHGDFICQSLTSYHIKLFGRQSSRWAGIKSAQKWVMVSKERILAILSEFGRKIK